MLTITIPSKEYFNEEDETIFTVKSQTLQLEHSLVAISKWEATWRKSFFKDDSKTSEETIDYIRCMTITQNVHPLVYKGITEEVMDQISEYISAPMTATVFSEDATNKGRKEVITSELIYHWMISLQIPFECQKWHINRLITLIRVCNIKNTPPKKMSKREIASRNSQLNAQRRQSLNSKG